MKDKYFLDTNIFVYTFDKSAKKKCNIAKELISDAITNNKGIISYQVIQEFLNVATRKFKNPMSLFDAEIYMKSILSPLCEIYPNIELFRSGLLIAQEKRYSFYDSLIIAAAVESGCSILYTEDLQNDHKIGDLKIVNPFK